MSCLLFAQGRIGKIQQKSLNNSLSVLEFTVASNTGDKDKEGNYRTEWTTFEVWGNRSDALFKILHVGDIVSVIAKKVTNKSTNSDGKERYFVSYRVDKVDVLYHKKSTEAPVQKKEEVIENDLGQDTMLPPVMEMPNNDLPF